MLAGWYAGTQGVRGRGERSVWVGGLLESKDYEYQDRWKCIVQHTGAQECWRAGVWKGGSLDLSGVEHVNVVTKEC